jgi:isoleucyl-tRNA synthetase
MELARTLVSLGRSARADAKLGVRQPLSRAIALLTKGERLRDEVVAEMKDELNVKAFEVVASLEGLLSYHVVPNFRALGPKLGKRLPRVKELLATADGAEVRRAFEETGEFALDVDGEAVTLTPDEVDIRAEQHEDLALAQDSRFAVALDLTLDDMLRAEGAAREFSRLLNDLRKARGFEISDRIAVRYFATGKVAAALEQHRDWIAGEALATEFVAIDAQPSGEPAAFVAGEPVWVELTRAAG